MADSGGSNNRLATALDLGEIVYKGNDQDAQNAASITFYDTVGAQGVSADRIDYFTLTPRGVDEVTVEFQVYGIGDYANIIYFVAHEGRSSIDGDVSWSETGGKFREQGGSDRFVSSDSGIQSDFHKLATDYADALRDDAGGDFDGAYQNATAAVNANGSATATWVLTGETIGFQAIGFQLDENSPGGVRALNEIAYSVTITPTAGQDLGLQAQGQTFSTFYSLGGPMVGDDRFNVFEAHSGTNSFDVSRVGADEYSVRFLPGSLRDGQEYYLDNIELIETTNGFVTLETDGKAGEVFRLYQTAFDRTPDPEGLGNWFRGYQDDAFSFLEMAGSFIESTEFANTYGAQATLSDGDYLTLLYANVLDRTPDADGFAFWADQQSNGISRAEMLGYFSQSAENVAKVAPTIDDGIWYI